MSEKCSKKKASKKVRRADQALYEEKYRNLQNLHDVEISSKFGNLRGSGHAVINAAGLIAIAAIAVFEKYREAWLPYVAAVAVVLLGHAAICLNAKHNSNARESPP